MARSPTFTNLERHDKISERATILDHIGHARLLKLNHVTDSLGVDIYVKCEFTNPGGSIKDRMALLMSEEAEKRGDLRPGGTISTSPPATRARRCHSSERSRATTSGCSCRRTCRAPMTLPIGSALPVCMAVM